MPIKVSLPATGGYVMSDIVDAIDFLAFDSILISGSATSVSLGGSYGGLAASATMTGSGFAMDVTGEYFVAGVISAITFTTSLGTINFSTVNIVKVDRMPVGERRLPRTQPGINNAVI